ncbi:MAG: HEPN domain-containing protein [Candidatus Jordarchaeales archaeon]
MAKSKVLLDEAKRDIEVGCYNKAVSAAYFALRMVVERYLDSLGAQYSKKDDKLANTIQSLGMKDVAYAMRVLFQARKRADHGDKLFTLEEAKDLLSMAESSWKTVLEAFKKKAGL